MKKFVAGFITGIMIMGSVFAGNEVMAQFADFNFLINGKEAKLETQPLVYDGKTYLPLRELASVLGYNIQFIEETRTISLINEHDSNQLIPARKLNELGYEIVIPDPKLNEAIIKYENVELKSPYQTINGQMFFEKSFLAIIFQGLS